MSIEPREIWFPARSYGWGWGVPVTWQGWLVVAAYLFLVMVGTAILPREHIAMYLIYVAILTAGLGTVCWLKGEKPGWRWGGK